MFSFIQINICFRFLNAFPRYGSFFKRRTNDKRDGCALMWRKDLFEYVDYEAIEFNQKPSSSSTVDISTSTTASTSTLPKLEFMDRDNVAQVVVLRERSASSAPRTLIVANTHILFNQGRGDVKLGQVLMLLSMIESMRKRHNANGILLAGLCFD